MDDVSSKEASGSAPRGRARDAMLLWSAVAALTVHSAFAATPKRDKDWEALIAEAKQHGGVETVLDKSASWVFQRPDGVYVTFTRVLKNSKRSVCLIAKNQNATVCVDWDSGKTSYGLRADAATPWTIHDASSVDEVAAVAPRPLQSLFSALQSILSQTKRGRSGTGKGANVSVGGG